MIALSLFLAATACFQSIVVDCSSVSDPETRLQCYDDAVKQIQRRPTQTNNAKPEELFGKSPAEVNRALTGEPDLRAIQAQVVGVAEIAYGRVRLSLDNQQTWRQVDGVRLRVREGDLVIIERAFAGSYLLRKTTGGRQIRVERTK